MNNSKASQTNPNTRQVAHDSEIANPGKRKKFNNVLHTKFAEHALDVLSNPFVKFDYQRLS